MQQTSSKLRSDSQDTSEHAVTSDQQKLRWLLKRWQNQTFCIACMGPFPRNKEGNWLRDQKKAIKIDNPYFLEENPYNIRTSWHHLQCWDAKVSPFSKLFECGDSNISLSNIQNAVDSNPSLLVGWKDELNCSDQLKVLQHAFWENLHSFSVTRNHVVMFVPCKSCSACLNPVESSTEISAFGT